MQALRSGPEREQSHGEGIANSISHRMALAAMLVGIPFLIMHGARQGAVVRIEGAGVFSVSSMLLYLSSTLYHALSVGEARPFSSGILAA